MRAQEVLEKHFATVDEAANLLNTSLRTAQRWCLEGKLDAVQLGSTHRSVWLVLKDEQGQPVVLDQDKN